VRVAGSFLLTGWLKAAPKVIEVMGGDKSPLKIDLGEAEKLIMALNLDEKVIEVMEEGNFFAGAKIEFHVRWRVPFGMDIRLLAITLCGAGIVSIFSLCGILFV
jgi:hypothetical protein